MYECKKVSIERLQILHSYLQLKLCVVSMLHSYLGPHEIVKKINSILYK